MTAARSIAHVSDLHFGRVDEALEEALLADLHALAPTLVVVSGDLTQRARSSQFRDARRFLDRLPAPYVVVPGNHDIPLFDVVRRILSPLGRYREHITGNLAPTYLDEGLAVLGLNTARPSVWKEGRISRAQLGLIRWLGSVEGALLRVLVTHHPFIPPPAQRTPVVRRGEEALRIAADCGVDLCLGGHLHLGYTGDAQAYHPRIGRSIVVAQAGTAISNRRRGEPNGYNFLRVSGDLLDVEVRIAAGDAYAPLRTSRFRPHADGLGAGRVSELPLHVTNGDSVVASIERAGLPGTALSWIDVLYEGPVPPDLDGAALARVRAEAAEALGWAPAGEVQAAYAERDAALDAADHVVLWFEHDLHDQLQLLQVLDRLASGPRGRRLEAIVVDHVPGREIFHGLGELEPEEIADLWPERRPVDPAQLALAQRAWAALRSSDPTALAALVHEGTHTLPLLAPALERLLEELPGAGDGLARSERQLLRAVGAGARTPHDAFLADAEQEDARYAGDTIVFARLERLAEGPHPLVAGPPDGALALTSDGERVLAGEVDAVALRGLDRWLGGTHLSAGTVWRWDAATGAVVRG